MGPVKKPAKELAKGPAKGPVKKPACVPAVGRTHKRKPAKGPTKGHAKRPAKRRAKKPTKKPAKRLARKPAKKLSKEPTKKLAKKNACRLSAASFSGFWRCHPRQGASKKLGLSFYKSTPTWFSNRSGFCCSGRGSTPMHPPYDLPLGASGLSIPSPTDSSKLEKRSVEQRPGLTKRLASSEATDPSCGTIACLPYSPARAPRRTLVL